MNQDHIDLLKGLVEIYSPNGQEKEAVTYLVTRMNALGYQAHIDPIGNAVGILGDGPREIMLLGHIDTVPGEITVRQEGDLLWGRGTVDAKGPLAAFTCAVSDLTPPPGWRIRVVGAVGEEGNSRGAKYLRDNHAPIPEMVIIGEPSGANQITLGYKGSAWFRCTVQRQLAHTAGSAESGPEAAVAFWNRIKAHTQLVNQGHDRVFEQISPTLREINTDSDGFSEIVQMNIGFRLPPGVTVADAAALIESLAAEGETVELIDGLPPYRSNKNNPLVRAFMGGIRAAGERPKFVLKTGTADFNVVGPEWKCPIIAYGPGDSSLDHTPHEHISLSEFSQSVAVLNHALTRLITES
jgi:[amino group carrier protein]-lysine/ornithine hydrolase